MLLAFLGCNAVKAFVIEIHYRLFCDPLAIEASSSHDLLQEFPAPFQSGHLPTVL